MAGVTRGEDSDDDGVDAFEPHEVSVPPDCDDKRGLEQGRALRKRIARRLSELGELLVAVDGDSQPFSGLDPAQHTRHVIAHVAL